MKIGAVSTHCCAHQIIAEHVEHKATGFDAMLDVASKPVAHMLWHERPVGVREVKLVSLKRVQH